MDRKFQHSRGRGDVGSITEGQSDNFGPGSVNNSASKARSDLAIVRKEIKFVLAVRKRQTVILIGGQSEPSI